MSTETSQSSPGPEAAEYALRLLPETEHRAFEADMRENPQLRAEVAFWNRHLVRLADSVSEVTPPAGLRKRLEARLFGRRRSGLGWLAGALSAAAVAVVGLAVLGPDLPGQPGETAIGADVFATTLETDNGRLTLSGTAEARDLVVEIAGPGPEPGTTYELWAVPEGEAAVLLGRIEDAPVQRFSLPADPSAMELAISLEDENGSPGDGTHGPVIAREFLTPQG